MHVLHGITCAQGHNLLAYIPGACELKTSLKYCSNHANIRDTCHDRVFVGTEIHSWLCNLAIGILQGVPRNCDSEEQNVTGSTNDSTF